MKTEEEEEEEEEKSTLAHTERERGKQIKNLWEDGKKRQREKDSANQPNTSTTIRG